ncbi:MAG: FAS1-like dehydratase domain-containing protein [Candidatus Binatia bacterium]
MTLDVDRSIIGQEFDHTVFAAVTEAQILAYAAAYGETDPLYTDPVAAGRGPHGALVGPPTFCLRLRGQHFMPREMPRNLGRSGFDAGKDIEIGVAVRAGDVLTSSSTVHDLYEKTGRTGRMVFIVFRTTVTNQRGETAAVIDQKMMFR